MKTDRELLELAAKAAWGFRPDLSSVDKGLPVLFQLEGKPWNPLNDDGDALRLAVKLGLRVFTPDSEPAAVADRYPNGPRSGVDAGADPYAATRRAIVRAAAAIGEQMP